MNSLLRKRLNLLCILLLPVGMFASPLPSSVRPAIPAEVQQLICVDYRALKNSDTAQQLKQQVLPENLKQFETALKGIGVLVDRDVDTLTFISYRQPKQGVQIVGAAQGVFSLKTVLAKLKAKKIKPVKYHDSDIYPMSDGMEMTFLDETTLLFGSGPALRGAVDARDGYVQTLDSNPEIANMIQDVESGTVWSILDQKGTQNMMLSALGDASGLADYDTIKKHILGSRYAMNFTNGVNFDLDVITSDSYTAGMLSSFFKMGMIYKKANASPVEKAALEGISVNSDSSKLQMHFKADDKQFQSLIHTPLFAAVSR
ncbi:MAG: hypothetical protein JWN74_1482 [Acidobacteriaceae bacterium]|jgi:hypothetical protein|nr:hypothetical protein [Acidobacteriaceae bacterium]